MARLVIVCGLLFIVLAPGAAHSEKRVALVIGNGAYEHAGRLANPANDASAVATALERLDFEVLSAIDATQADMLAILDRFAQALAGADAAVFFYAGHGIQIGGQNFLLPVDITADSERTLRYGGIDVGEVVADMESQAAVNLVILDACRNNPFVEQLQRSAKTRSTNVGRGLALLKPSSSGTIVAFAAAAGEVANDGAGHNSPYTTALLKEIEAPGTEVALVFRRVAGHVIKETNGAQQPELLVRLVNEFYLNPVDALTPPVSSAEQVSQASAPTEASGDNQPLSTAAAQSAVIREPIIRPQWARIAPRDVEGVVWSPPSGQNVSPQEPNDGPAAAAQVGPKDTLELAIESRGDEDWLILEVGSAGVLSLSTSDAPEAIDLATRILDADLRVLHDWQVAPRPGGELNAQFDLPKLGRYYVVVSDSYHDAEALIPFTLKLDFEASVDLREVNNSIGAAWPIAANGTVAASIFPRGDTDWYQLWVEASGELSVAMTGVPPEIDMAMRLHNADGQVVQDWTVAPRPGGDLSASLDLKQPGAYFLEIADSYADARSPKPYAMATTFTPSADAYEPNNSFADAKPISATGRHRLTVLPRGDVDWLRFDVDHPGELSIAAIEVPKRLDIAFRVYNHDKAVIADWIPAPRPGGDTTATVDLPAVGTYYLEIADGAHDAREIVSFVLETSFVPEPDQYEPNNSPGQATPIRGTGEILFNILPRGDTDWFSLKVESAGELKVSLDDGPPELDLHFRVWNADRTVIRDWVAPYAKGGLTDGIADLPAAGLYFIEVTDGQSDARSVVHATLSTRFSATREQHEPNNSFGEATALPLSGSLATHILPKGDTDWFSISVPSAGTLAVEIDDVPEPLDVVFRVHDGNGIAQPWQGPFRKDGGRQIQIPLSAAGSYRIEIADSNHDARSPAAFTFKWMFSEGATSP